MAFGFSLVIVGSLASRSCLQDQEARW